MRKLAFKEDLTPLSDRIAAIESAPSLSSINNRVTSVEQWRAAKANWLGAKLVPDLVTNLNPLTSLIGVITSALNTTNDKVNKLITKVGNMQDTIEAREITKTS